MLNERNFADQRERQRNQNKSKQRRVIVFEGTKIIPSSTKKLLLINFSVGGRRTQGDTPEENLKVMLNERHFTDT